MSTEKTLINLRKFYEDNKEGLQALGVDTHWQDMISDAVFFDNCEREAEAPVYNPHGHFGVWNKVSAGVK